MAAVGSQAAIRLTTRSRSPTTPETIHRGAFVVVQVFSTRDRCPVSLTRVDADVALASLTAGRACQMGQHTVVGCMTLSGLAWERAKRSRSEPAFVYKRTSTL